MTAAPSRPDVVPYIAAWSGEQPQRRTVVYLPGCDGIGFADETPEDRDQFGVLWNSRATARGAGRPEFGDVHPDRQRVCMQNELCQVCGLPADRDDRGVLWLLEDARGDYKGWPNDLLTTHPPVCRPCARTSIRLCPHLRRSVIAVRVGASEVCAVYGRLWARSLFGFPVRLDRKEVVAYGTPRARWVLAGQLLRALSDCTIVSLDEIEAHP